LTKILCYNVVAVGVGWPKANQGRKRHRLKSGGFVCFFAVLCYYFIVSKIKNKKHEKIQF